MRQLGKDNIQEDYPQSTLRHSSHREHTGTYMVDKDKLDAAICHLEDIDDAMAPNLVLEIEFMERNQIDGRLLFPFVRERLNDEWSPLRGGDYENIVVANEEPLTNHEVADILSEVISGRRKFLGLKADVSTDWDTEKFELPAIDPFLNASRTMRSTSGEEEKSISIYIKDNFPEIAEYAAQFIRFAREQGYERVASGEDQSVFKTPLFQVYAWIARNSLNIDAQFIDLISVSKHIARSS
jgi:hypothetical protein